MKDNPTWNEKLTQYAGEIEALIREGAPHAYDLTKTVVQVDAIQEIVAGLVCALYVGVFIYYGRRLPGEEEDLPVLFLGGIVAAVAAVASAILLLDVWNYIALVNPDAAIAKNVYDALIKQ